MLNHVKFAATSVLAISALVLTNAPCCAQEISFPWGCAKNTQPNPVPAPSARYLTLAPRDTATNPEVPSQQMPPKSGYAYGWFGSNPTPHWSRHFGTMRDYTQWTQR